MGAKGGRKWWERVAETKQGRRDMKKGKKNGEREERAEEEQIDETSGEEQTGRERD